MSYQTPTDDEAAREAKLPDWARATINRLRSDAAYNRLMLVEKEREVEKLEQRIAQAAESDTGPEDSTAWLYRETGGEILPSLGLGAGALIDFRPTDTIEISVSAHGNGIRVCSDLRLMIIPMGQSEFRIQPVSAKIKD